MDTIEKASRLKHFREQIGLSQSQFAQKLGIPRTSLINWEKGVSIPVDILIPLKEFFNLNIDWFLTGNGEPLNNNDSSSKNQKQQLKDTLKSLATKLNEISVEYEQIPSHLRSIINDLKTLDSDRIKMVEGAILAMKQQQFEEESKREDHGTKAG